MTRARLPAPHIGARPWRRLRWLVLAPHPDDETLGAGALIRQAARERRLAGLVYLTDGSGSHDVGEGGRGRLVDTRRREGELALRRLAGPACPPPARLGWRDAAPPAAGTPAFGRACRTLAALCRARRVDALAVTALGEPHCDHDAAARLAYALRRVARRPIAIFEYAVWGDAPARSRYRAVRTAPFAPGLRRHALFAHRSQLGASLGRGFRLPRAATRMPCRDILYQRRTRDAP